MKRLSPVSKPLRRAIKDYYGYHKDKSVTSMRLITIKDAIGEDGDAVLVRIRDAQGRYVSTICSYDGSKGILRKPEDPYITEIDYCYRSNRNDLDTEEMMIDNANERDDRLYPFAEPFISPDDIRMERWG